MKQSFSILWLVFAALWSGVVATGAQVNVTQHRNHDLRDGLYVDSAFTQSAAANLTRDLGFDGTIVGNVYAQPLYIDDGPGGRPTIIAATESNNVYALDAVDSSVIWQRNVGTPVPLANLPCGNIDPNGITGTPVIDLGSRSLFFERANNARWRDDPQTLHHFPQRGHRGYQCRLARRRGADGPIQRHDVHSSKSNAINGTSHRGQRSLRWIWESLGLQRLSWLVGGSADK